jgi:hypothetical protein
MNTIHEFNYGGRRLRVVECDWTKPEFRFDVLDELGSLAIGYPSREAAIEDAKRIVDLEAKRIPSSSFLR